jgi:hypothetical protein
MKPFHSSAAWVVLSAIGLPFASTRHQDSSRPSVSRNLSDESTFRDRMHGDYFNLKRPALGFLGDSTVILSYDTKTALEHEVAAGNTFNVLMISAADGRTVTRLQVNALSGASQAMPVSKDDFVVLSGEKLSRYSRGLQITKQVTVDPPVCSMVLTTPGDFVNLRCIYNMQRLDVSPDRSKLLMRSDERRQESTPPRYKWTWFDTGTLEQTAQWVAPGNTEFRAANSEFISGLGGRGHAYLVTEGARSSICADCFQAFFVAPDLRVEDSGKRLELKNSAGDVLYRANLSDSTSGVAASAESSMFVYVTVTGGLGGLPSFGPPKVHFKLHVCDWKEKREVAIFRYDVAQPGPEMSGASQSSVAISPNGRVVALIVDSTLTLFYL